MSLKLRSGLLGIVVLSIVSGANGIASGTITENWDSLPATAAPTVSGSFYPLGDGWTAINSDVTQNNFFGVESSGAGESANSGPNWIAQFDGNNRDGATNSLMVLSPKFTIDGSGSPISMSIEGGSNGTTPPTTITGIGTTLAATGNGWQGVALLDNSGNVLETAQRTSNAMDYQALQLPTTSLNTSSTYQVAFIDTYTGGWGWVAMDDVTIPGTAVPEPASLSMLGLAAFGLLARRRTIR